MSRIDLCKKVNFAKNVSYEVFPRHQRNAKCSLCYVKYISVKKKAEIESFFTAI